MNYLAPIVLLLGLSGALYQTKEVYPLTEYEAVYDKKKAPASGGGSDV